MRGIGAELIGGGESTAATELGVASAMEDLGLKGLGFEGAVEDKAVAGSRIRMRAARHARMASAWHEDGRRQWRHVPRRGRAGRRRW